MSSTSFTENALIRMIHSDWLSPSIYKPTQGKDIDELYTKRQQREDISQTGNICRLLARTIYMIGVNILVSPVGAIYHSAQLSRSLYHSVPSFRKLVTILSDFEIKTREKKLINKFFGKVKEMPSFIALKKDLIFPAPLIPAIFCLKGYKNLPSSYRSYGAIGFCIPVLYNLGLTVYGSIHTVGLLGAMFCEKKHEVYQKAFRRMAFNNVDLTCLAQECFDNRKQALENSIISLQKALPKDHKMPIFSFPMKSEVLDWAEEHKEYLNSVERWNGFEELIQQFTKKYDQFIESDQYDKEKILSERLRGFLSKFFGEKFSPAMTNEFENAFALGPKESAARMTVRQRDLVQGSFTLEVFKRMCGSHYFYPSSFELLKRKNCVSLTDAIDNDNPFIQRKRKSYSIGKSRPFCFLARSVAFIAMAYLIVPSGILYHSSQAFTFAIKLLTDGENQRHQNKEKMMAHLSSAWVDASFVLSGGHLIPAAPLMDIKTICSLILGLLYGLKYIFELRASMGSAYALRFILNILKPLMRKTFIYSFPLFASAAFWSATSFVPCFAYRDERSALFKAIALRETCGYSDLDGKILSYNKRLDNQVDPDLGLDYELLRFWIETGMEIVERIKIVYSQLPKEQQSKFLKAFQEDHIDYDKIERLQTSSENFEKSTFEKSTNEIASYIKKNPEIERILELKDALEDCRNLIVRCYEMFHADRFSGKTVRISLSLFPYKIEKLKEQLRKECVSTFTPWKRIIEREKLVLQTVMPEGLVLQDGDKVSELGKRMLKLYELIQRKNPLVTSYEILEISPDADQVFINNSYKKAALIFHPDRVPEHLREKATFFFKIIKEAQNESLKELTNKSRRVI